jgi:hypothetical protein
MARACLRMHHVKASSPRPHVLNTVNYPTLLQEAFLAEDSITVEEDFGLVTEPLPPRAESALEDMLPQDNGAQPSTRAANAHRHAKRRANRSARDPPPVNEHTIRRHVQPSVPIPIDVVAREIRVQSGAYEALNEPKSSDAQKIYTMDEMQSLGFDYIRWDGR